MRKGVYVMEEKNKTRFSTILLVVGVLFIVVSGGIFVSRTWQYLPDFVKRFSLVAVTAGFFTGSWYAEKKSLKKTGTALYYLGVCFTGFSTIAMLSLFDAAAELVMTLTLLAMLVPVVIRFFQKRMLVDLILQFFLCDGMILSLSTLGEDGMEGKISLLLFSIMTMAISGLLYYCRRTNEENANTSRFVFSNAMLAVISIAYCLHAFICLPGTLLLMITETSFFFALFPVYMLVASVTVIWIVGNKNTALRVVQSFFLTYGVLATCVFFLRDNLSTAFFAAFAIVLIMMIVLDRMELLAVCSVVGFLASFIQICGYAIDHDWAAERFFCHPYGISLVIALLIWNYFTKSDATWRTVIKACVIYGVVNFITIISYFSGDFALHFGIAFFVSLAFLFVSVCIEDVRGVEILCKLLHSAALGIAMLALLCRPIIPTTIWAEDGTTILANFDFEYIIIFLGLGIVLLGKIWYDTIEKVRILQFIGACLLTALLILNNLAAPALPNVLFLGVSALAMLIIGTILKQKKYAILAAVTLILVALYITRELWMSIAWWVYLFVAGVGLVIFAIKKEKAEN